MGNHDLNIISSLWLLNDSRDGTFTGVGLATGVHIVCVSGGGTRMFRTYVLLSLRMVVCWKATAVSNLNHGLG